MEKKNFIYFYPSVEGASRVVLSRVRGGGGEEGPEGHRKPPVPDNHS